MESDVMKVYVSSGNCVSPLGFTLEAHEQALEAGKLAIEEVSDHRYSDKKFYAAIIAPERVEKAFDHLPYSGYFTKLEKMLLLAAHPVIQDAGMGGSRSGLIISTTKGNIEQLGEAEEEYFLPCLAKKIGKTLGFTNEPIVLSNACVSGIMAVSVARRLIQTGLYDHVTIIAGDIFSKFVFSGFQSFQAVSTKPCKPYTRSRDGITLGEAAAAMVVTKDGTLAARGRFYIAGDSSVNDANHISGPSRTGEGLYRSIDIALKEAGLKAGEVSYISAHGTATLFNDEMEAQAFTRAGLAETPLASLKGCFGHTLGAAGLLETILTLRFAEKGKLLPSFGFDEAGLTIPLHIVKEFEEAEVRTVMKTASGFGGSNTAVVFKRG